MKQFLLLASICLLITTCKCNKNEDQSGQDGKENKNISSRDYSIQRSIAYSDLFLDSVALEKFITASNVADSLARRMHSFYNTRNYQFAWFNRQGFTEQAFGFWNLLDHYTTYSGDTSLSDKALNKRMDNLLTEDTLNVRESDPSFIKTELELTLDFIRYSRKNYEKGYVKRKELERFVPRKKQDALYLADSLLNKKHKDNKYFENINESYAVLKEQLQKYVDIARQGGWAVITTSPKSLMKGSSFPEIATIKLHLALTGDLAVKDTSQVFNDTLTGAVKSFQERHGLKSTGSIGPETLKELNVPVTERIKQLLINMERMRWMPSQPEGNMMLVNIPEFVLHAMEGKNKAFDMKIIVGKEGHNTMMFTKTLNQVVFSPYWNIPPSIVQKEILPDMEKHPDYLAGQNMEIIGNNEGVPDIRQLPGPKNPLGKVKFLFPNSYNIYFHDTPEKSLFQKYKRAFSHGCIRLGDAKKMAEYLLRNDPNWNHEKIQDAMSSGKERLVILKDPVVVFITYYTAWVDEKGKLNFREDIYDHDKKLTGKMFL